MSVNGTFSVCSSHKAATGLEIQHMMRHMNDIYNVFMLYFVLFRSSADSSLHKEHNSTCVWKNMMVSKSCCLFIFLYELSLLHSFCVNENVNENAKKYLYYNSISLHN